MKTDNVDELAKLLLSWAIDNGEADTPSEVWNYVEFYMSDAGHCTDDCLIVADRAEKMFKQQQEGEQA